MWALTPRGLDVNLLKEAIGIFGTRGLYELGWHSAVPSALSLLKALDA